MRLILVYLGSPKMTVGVSAIVLGCGEARVLLVHHTYRRPAWGLPSGLISHREDPNAALEREVREELGVPATINGLLHAETHAPVRHLTLYYQTSLQGIPRTDGVEIDAWKYASLEELEGLLGGPPGAWLWAARAYRTVADCVRAAA